MSSEIFILRKVQEILHFYGFRHCCWYFWFKPSRFKLIRTIKNLIFISKCRFALLNMNLSTLYHFPTRPYNYGRQSKILFGSQILHFSGETSNFDQFKQLSVKNVFMFEWFRNHSCQKKNTMPLKPIKSNMLIQNLKT